MRCMVPKEITSTTYKWQIHQNWTAQPEAFLARQTLYMIILYARRSTLEKNKENMGQHNALGHCTGLNFDVWFIVKIVQSNNHNKFQTQLIGGNHYFSMLQYFKKKIRLIGVFVVCLISWLFKTDETQIEGSFQVSLLSPDSRVLFLIALTCIYCSSHCPVLQNKYIHSFVVGCKASLLYFRLLQKSSSAPCATSSHHCTTQSASSLISLSRGVLDCSSQLQYIGWVSNQAKDAHQIVLLLAS